MRNVYEVYIQYLSCKEQTPTLPWNTRQVPPGVQCGQRVYSVGPGNPSVLCGGRIEQAEAPGPGPWIPNTGLGAGELRGQGSPGNSWALPFPFHSLLLPPKQTKSKDSLTLKTVFQTQIRTGSETSYTISVERRSKLVPWLIMKRK